MLGIQEIISKESSKQAFSELATDTQIERVVNSLEANGIRVIIAENGEEARRIFFELIPEGAEVFLGASLQELGSVGPATLELIDREVERIVGDSVTTAEEILRANWSAVYEIANALVDQETLSGVALEALLSPVQPTLLDFGSTTAEAPTEEHHFEPEAQPEGD